MIASKYSTRIYTEQATILVFKQSSSYAIYYFLNSLQTDKHDLSFTADTFLNKNHISQTIQPKLLKLCHNIENSILYDFRIMKICSRSI